MTLNVVSLLQAFYVRFIVFLTFGIAFYVAITGVDKTQSVHQVFFRVEFRVTRKKT